MIGTLHDFRGEWEGSSLARERGRYRGRSARITCSIDPSWILSEDLEDLEDLDGLEVLGSLEVLVDH